MPEQNKDKGSFDLLPSVAGISGRTEQSRTGLFHFDSSLQSIARRINAALIGLG
jgi:hypothetical protein